MISFSVLREGPKIRKAVRAASLVAMLATADRSLLAQSSAPVGSMITPRAAHTATLLSNGMVLIAGGVKAAFPWPDIVLSSAELYDPFSRSFTRTGDMSTARAGHTATLLADGRVLIVGGSENRSAEIYDPATGMFSPTAVPPPEVSWLGAAVRLWDGRVFVAASPTAQLYDPLTGTFGPAAAYAFPAPTFMASTVLLAGGRVLATGETVPGVPPRGISGWSEVYDPVSNSFSATGDMNFWNSVYTATLLPSGRVLYVGSEEGDGIPADVEIFDPAQSAFSRAARALFNHEFAAANLLPDGTVLITGGQVPGGNGQPLSEVYSPANGMFSLSVDLITPRHQQTSTVLADGTVLIAGGYFLWPSATSSAEVYRPAVSVPAPSLFSMSPDGRGQGAIWHASTGQLASVEAPARAGDILSMYTTTLIATGVIPPQVSIGGRLAETLFFGNAPGYPGFNQVNVLVPNGIAPGPTVSVRLSYLGRFSNEVTVAVQ